MKALIGEDSSMASILGSWVTKKEEGKEEASISVKSEIVLRTHYNLWRQRKLLELFSTGAA